MTEADARYAAELFTAIAALPKVRRALTNKPSRYHDAVYLEMQAAEMSDGTGQGCNHYFDLPPALGRAILDAAEQLICAEMKRLKLNVTPPRKRKVSQ